MRNALIAIALVVATAILLPFGAQPAKALQPKILSKPAAAVRPYPSIPVEVRA